MPMTVKAIAHEVMQLLRHERRELFDLLVDAIHGEPDDNPEAVAAAWDKEIERRVEEMEAGRTQWIPSDEATARIRAAASGKR